MPLASAVERTRQGAGAGDTSNRLVARIDARGLPASTGFHEVWLLDADATNLVTLGALPNGSVGTFKVPLRGSMSPEATTTVVDRTLLDFIAARGAGSRSRPPAS